MLPKRPNIEHLNESYAKLELAPMLSALCKHFPGKIGFSSSLGPEDQVITDAIFRHAQPIEIFTLDTGRMFPETYSVLDETRQKYQGEIKVYYPNQETLQDFVNQQGINAFYESVNARKSCCSIRKIEPLNHALTGTDVWVSGIRAQQSKYRSEMKYFEWDADRQLVKFNPLLNWTTDSVWRYINKHEVPYNALHSKGYPSIGCQPCTRAIGLHENERAGRWWWELENAKECGLHTA